MPRIWAAQATAAPWLPDDTATTPRDRWSGGISDIRLNAPRNLKAPARCCDSSLPNTVAPVRASRRSECSTGVTTASPAMTAEAARMSSMSITRRTSVDAPVDGRGAGTRPSNRCGRTRNPCSASHFCNESAPRCFWTTSAASPCGESRASQVRSSSCSWSLPMRIGGLDQMVAKRTSVGTSSGRATTMLVMPLRSALRTTEFTGAAVHVDRPHGCAGRPARHRQGDGTGATPEVEEIALVGEGQRCSQQHRRRRVEMTVGEHPAVGLHREGRVREGHVDDHRSGCHPRVVVEVLVGGHSP